MAIAIRPNEEIVERSALERRPMRVCSYVELPLDEMATRLARAGSEEAVSAAIEALHVGTAVDGIRVEAQPLETVAHRVARIRMSWRGDEASGGSGMATISLLAVQTGSRPLTEVLIDIPVRDADAREGAAAARRLLDELIDRLARSAPPGARDGI